MIQVVNKRTHIPTPNDIYIGRGSKLGNIYSHIPSSKAEFIVESREIAIAKYEQWLKKKIEEKDHDVTKALNYIWYKARFNHVNLVCYCYPNSCHGEVIKKLVEAKL